VSNPFYHECDEIMVSFMMYTVSDSDKQGVKGVHNSMMGKCDSMMNENHITPCLRTLLQPQISSLDFELHLLHLIL
jgi:hypothetical protein